MKSYRNFLLLITGLFIVFVLVEYYKPEPVDWTKTFINKDKSPFGTYILYNQLPVVFRGKRISPVREPIYNQLNKNYFNPEFEENSEAQEAITNDILNYVFINSSFRADSLDINHLLRFAEKGNQVFIAANSIQAQLLDTLNIQVNRNFKFSSKDSVVLRFANRNLKDIAKIPERVVEYYFTVTDSSGNGDLQSLASIDSAKVVFTRVTFGKGLFYLCSVPELFSNFYLLKKKSENLAFYALSYLPVSEVYWDEYQKQGAIGEDSILRAVLENKSLKWAYYLVIASVFLFILFEAKRKQRIIPVIEPPLNSTLEFTRTLGNLYLSKSDHKNIAVKKITYFYEYLREHYRITVSEINEALIETIASKSGSDKNLVDDIFRMINYVQYNNSITEKNLLDLNILLERFYLHRK